MRKLKKSEGDHRKQLKTQITNCCASCANAQRSSLKRNGVIFIAMHCEARVIKETDDILWVAPWQTCHLYSEGA